MKIRDTLSGLMAEPGTPTRIYLCGITTYDDSHIGHARTIIIFDVLRRRLESSGGKVRMVQNFTDIDDKIIARAKTESIDASEISDRYVKNYFRDFDELGVLRADSYPMATEHIGEIIEFIKKLVNTGRAYATKNGVYFDVPGFARYGALSRKKIDELRAGARIEIDESKRDPLDFALWKNMGDGPSWESPWGTGRPGWHIECSAMSSKYLGENFEVHGGGRDLVFPHHENELAQTEAYTGKPLAKIWMHVGMVTIDGQKMAKSTGNVRSVRGALDRWGPNVVRIFCLSGHYSKPIDYTEDLLRESLERWRQAEACYYETVQADGAGGGSGSAAAEFDAALDDDLNTHLALSAFFGMVKVANKDAAEGKLGADGAAEVRREMERMMKVLGLVIPIVTEEEAREIGGLISQREDLRAQKKFKDADELRNKLDNMGITLLDRGNRAVWIKREEIPADDASRA